MYAPEVSSPLRFRLGCLIPEFNVHQDRWVFLRIERDLGEISLSLSGLSQNCHGTEGLDL